MFHHGQTLLLPGIFVGPHSQGNRKPVTAGIRKARSKAHPIHLNAFPQTVFEGANQNRAWNPFGISLVLCPVYNEQPRPSRGPATSLAKLAKLVLSCIKQRFDGKPLRPVPTSRANFLHGLSAATGMGIENLEGFTLILPLRKMLVILDNAERILDRQLPRWRISSCRSASVVTSLQCVKGEGMSTNLPWMGGVI